MISLVDVSIRQGSFALAGISLEVPAGQYAVLMGRTGSGKTTVLEAICGLRPVAGGRIVLQGQDVTHWGPAARGVGYVPQDAALFPTMTVRQHLAFALEIRRWKRAAIDQRVGELASLLGLEQLLGRKPAGLSGGESQRVALGRALALRPKVLLLDEPLSALDDDTRQEMYALLQRIRQQDPPTVLHVTHNRADAENLAQRVVELRGGKVRMMNDE